MDVAGTMAGGGTRVSKGRMGSQVVEDLDPKQLEKLENQLKVDTADMNKFRESKTTLEETVEKLSRQSKELQHGVEKFKVEVAGLTEQVSSLKQQVGRCWTVKTVFVGLEQYGNFRLIIVSKYALNTS